MPNEALDSREFLSVDYHLSGPTQGILVVREKDGVNTVYGCPNLNRKSFKDLTNPKAIGTVLFESLFPPGDKARESYKLAFHDAQKTGATLRFRLDISLSEPWLYSLPWETLYDTVNDTFVARDPRTVFSRNAPTGRDEAPAILTPPRLRMLVAVSSPKNSADHHMTCFDRSAMYNQVEKALEPLSHVVQWKLLEGSTTPSRLRSELVSGRFHILHLVAHGFVEENQGTLVLETEKGECEFVQEKYFTQIFLGDRHLRLLTLMSCRGGDLSDIYEPLSGVAGRLVAAGLPAVIAMQDGLTFKTAEEFTHHFYEILGKTGCIDAAVNEARHQLYLNLSKSSRWIKAILYMHLVDGMLWLGPPLPPPPPRRALDLRWLRHTALGVSCLLLQPTDTRTPGPPLLRCDAALTDVKITFIEDDIVVSGGVETQALSTADLGIQVKLVSRGHDYHDQSGIDQSETWRILPVVPSEMLTPGSPWSITTELFRRQNAVRCDSKSLTWSIPSE